MITVILVYNRRNLPKDKLCITEYKMYSGITAITMSSNSVKPRRQWK